VRIWSFIQLMPIKPLSFSVSAYKDIIGVQYSWDSTVANHSKVAVNDYFVLVDDKMVLGYGLIERLESYSSIKTRQRCTKCKSTKFSARSERYPEFRCTQCKEEFSSPLQEVINIISYDAFYQSFWKPISNAPKSLLSSAYISKAVQQSIRELSFQVVNKSLNINLGMQFPL